MSFDCQLLTREIKHRLKNGYGWSDEVAGTAAGVAIDAIKFTHGGDRHYIPSRSIDHKAIRAEHAEGAGNEELARRHGVTSRTIRNIIK